MLSFLINEFKIILSIFLSLVLIISCHSSSADEINKDELETILENIATAFNNDDIDAIMQNYLEDFKHNDLNYNSMKLFWQIQRIDYVDMFVDNISVEIQDYRAVMTFTMTFLSGESEIVSQEPSEEYGFISYYRKINGVWYVCGKDYGNFR